MLQIQIIAGTVIESNSDKIHFRSHNLIDVRNDITIGRQDCDLLTGPRCSSVSRQHAILMKTLLGWKIRDFGSSYGTHIQRGDQNIRVDVETVQRGDVIFFGTAPNALVVKVL